MLFLVLITLPFAVTKTRGLEGSGLTQFRFLHFPAGPEPDVRRQLDRARELLSRVRMISSPLLRNTSYVAGAGLRIGHSVNPAPGNNSYCLVLSACFQLGGRFLWTASGPCSDGGPGRGKTAARPTWGSPKLKPAQSRLIFVAEHNRIGRVSEMIFLFFRAFALACRGHHELVLENLALRQQLGALKRTTKRPRLRTVDRVFWIRHGDYGSGLQSHESVAKPVRGTPDRFDSPRVSGSRDRHQRPTSPPSSSLVLHLLPSEPYASRVGQGRP
jgi:hypothetical protein